MDGAIQKGVKDEKQLLDIALSCSSGLQALHRAGIIHRDIKPQNLLYRSQDNRVKLADLGIALDINSAEDKNEFTGTIPYMAPELFNEKYLTYTVPIKPKKSKVSKRNVQSCAKDAKNGSIEIIKTISNDFWRSGNRMNPSL